MKGSTHPVHEACHAPGAWGLSCTWCVKHLMHPKNIMQHCYIFCVHEVPHAPGAWESPCTGCMTGLMHRVHEAIHNGNTFFGTHCILKFVTDCESLTNLMKANGSWWMKITSSESCCQLWQIMKADTRQWKPGLIDDATVSVPHFLQAG